MFQAPNYLLVLTIPSLALHLGSFSYLFINLFLSTIFFCTFSYLLARHLRVLPSLLRSDGKKARRFSHLLDDTKSTCSTASSSVAESLISRDSSVPAGAKLGNHVNSLTSGSTSNINQFSHDTESNASLAPVSKSLVEQLAKLNVSCVCCFCCCRHIYVVYLRCH